MTDSQNAKNPLDILQDILNEEEAPDTQQPVGPTEEEILAKIQQQQQVAALRDQEMIENIQTGVLSDITQSDEYQERVRQEEESKQQQEESSAANQGHQINQITRTKI